MAISTTKNITGAQPSVDPEKVCGAYLRYPESPDRRLELGLRLEGKYKSSDSNLPLVTIITVVLNRSDTIERCMKSVFDQSYENIEYIIIDGGSTDGTTDKIRRYSDAIDYAISEPDSGIYNAINKGIRLATGDFVLLLNSDDWYSDDAVSLLVSHAINNDSQVTHANAYTVSESGNITGALNGWLNEGLYTRGMPVRHETMLVNKQIYNKYGYYDESYSIISDYHYLIKLYKNKCSFSHLDREILYFSEHGISNIDDEKRFSERARLFRVMFPFLEQPDLDLIKRKGRLAVNERLALINKYRQTDGAEDFINSMIFNIGASVAKGESNGRPGNILRKMKRWLIPNI